MFRAMLSGPTISRAPENDEGHDADLDLDEDFSLDEPDEDQDEPDEDADEVDVLDLEDVDEPPTRQSRGESRVATATKVAAEAKREAAELRERLAALEAQRNAPAPEPRETAAQREQRLANLEPWERTEALRQEDSAATRQTLARIEWESKENADKVAYEALCARAPVAAKLKDEVETRLADMRKAGTTAPRETVLRWVIGDRALANGSKAAGKARTTAAGNRDRQATRPASGRGDAAPEGRRGTTDQARAKRLETYSL
jgi:hypothetical protein